MSKVYSRFDRPETQPVEAGTFTEPVYTMRLDDQGNKELYKTGETQTYQLIQASLESTKIENILERATWDPEALMQMQGTYMDVTGMPTTLAQAQQMIIDVTTEFENLPIETRAAFEHNADKYINQYGTEEWARKMGLEIEKRIVPAKEVSKNESEQ